jgi:uncharacterized protein YjiS (DUF1127 family)
MALANAAVNLFHLPAKPHGIGRWLDLLLKVEAWLDARKSRRALNDLDDRTLHDIGLTRDDVDRFDEAASWQALLGLRPR